MFLTNKDWENIHTAVTRHFFPVTASIGYKGYRQQYCLFSFPNFNPVTRRGGHWTLEKWTHVPCHAVS